VAAVAPSPNALFLIVARGKPSGRGFRRPERAESPPDTAGWFGRCGGIAGPFALRPELKLGTGERLLAIGPPEQHDASVAHLTGELGFEAFDRSELLRVVLIDHERDFSDAHGQ
jgi:hypothetical protein